MFQGLTLNQKQKKTMTKTKVTRRSINTNSEIHVLSEFLAAGNRLKKNKKYLKLIHPQLLAIFGLTLAAVFIF